VGGSFIYSSGPNSLRDTVGTFVNVPVITYEQTIEAPYIGAAFDWKKERMTLGFKVIGSFLVSAKTVDHHHLRDLTFTDNFKKGKMLGGAVHFAYKVAENTNVGIAYRFQSYFENRGNSVTYDKLTGQRTLFVDSSGMSLNYQILEMSAVYNF